MEKNKHAKVTLCEQRRNPERGIRTKKRDDLMLVQMDLNERTFRVIQERTTHLAKYGIRQGPNLFLMLEEVIYLAELGAVGVLIEPKSNEFLSLNQLYALLPLFNVTLFELCAFRSLTKATYRVRKPVDKEERNLFHYNVYAKSRKGILFDENLYKKFLKFHLFVCRSDEQPSNALLEFARNTKTPVFRTSGQSSCVRFVQILSPINIDFSAVQLPSALDADEDASQDNDEGSAPGSPSLLDLEA